MSGIGILWAVVAALGIISGLVMWIGDQRFDREVERRKQAGDRSEPSGAMPITGFLGLVLTGILVLAVGFMSGMPQYRLWKASVEKRILVEQAIAEADSAVEQKRAEITRAEGVAEANVIIANSIDEQYLRYLFVNALNETSNQVIYVPTEANLPILEAGRTGMNQGTDE